jgi:glycosyltransferase involved in cell wall biosynthesis
MKHRDRISVVIPLYNKAQYILDAISSAIAQGDGVGEIIVVDDGSVDSGAALVAEIAKNEPKIRLLHQKNGGVSAARNTGIRAAREELVAFLDADDWYLPGYIESLLALNSAHKNAVMFCTGYYVVFGNGTRQTRLLKSNTPEIWSGVISNFYREWINLSFTCTNAIALRREFLLKQQIWFPVGERLGEDQDVWFRIAESGAVVYRNAPLVAYRQDVIGSATYETPTPTNILPCYKRLAERLSRGEVPRHMIRSAQRLFASHVLNIANARLRVGNTGGAWMLILDPRVRSNLGYLVKTLCRYGCAIVARRRIAP